MKNFKAISMDCNEQQFESMKQELIELGCVFPDLESFDERNHLVNNQAGKEKRIMNFSYENSKASWDRTYIGAFDKEAFLKACGKAGRSANEIEKSKESFEEMKSKLIISELKKENNCLRDDLERLLIENNTLKELKKEKTSLLKSKNRYKQLYQQEKDRREMENYSLENRCDSLMHELAELKGVKDELYRIGYQFGSENNKLKKQLKLTLIAISAILVSNIIYLALC